MSLLSVPFVGTSADTALHVISAVTLIATIAAVALGFWKFHELPINKAHSKDHQQIALITALTWIGFIWHWVWVLAVIISFVDLEKGIINLRDTWHGKHDSKDSEANAPTTEKTQNPNKENTPC